MLFRIFINYLLIFFLFVMSNCHKNPTASPEQPNVINLDQAIHEVDMSIVYYDIIYIKSRDSFIISDTLIDQIVFTKQFDNDTTFTDTIQPRYTEIDQAYKVLFDHSFKVSSDHNTYLNCDLIITYQIFNRDPLMIDTLFAMYKYPYEDTEIFFNTYENLPTRYYSIQGFEIVNNVLYFCPSGPIAGIVKYDFNTGSRDDLIITGSGNYIAADSSYIFHDPGHEKIIRYNFEEKKVDLTFLLDDMSLGVHWVAGLALYENYLYALISNDYVGANKLIKFDFSGNLIEEIPFGKKSRHLEIYNDVVYSLPLNSEKILLFDLKSRSFLESIPPPSSDLEGIRIYDNMVYFSKFMGKAIFILSLDNLNIN